MLLTETFFPFGGNLISKINLGIGNKELFDMCYKVKVNIFITPLLIFPYPGFLVIFRWY